RRAVHADVESVVRTGLLGGVAGRHLSDLGVSRARAVRAGETADHSGPRRWGRALPGWGDRLLPVAPARGAEGAARLPTRRSDRDDHDRPLLRDGGAVRRRVWSRGRAATGGDDPRVARDRDAAVPRPAAALRDRHRRLPRRDSDAARCGVDDADARTAAVAL